MEEHHSQSQTAQPNLKTHLSQSHPVPPNLKTPLSWQHEYRGGVTILTRDAAGLHIEQTRSHQWFLSIPSQGSVVEDIV